MGTYTPNDGPLAGLLEVTGWAAYLASASELRASRRSGCEV